MRLRFASLVLVCSGAAAVWACSLNPQPFPPDSYDASADVSLTNGPDAAGGIPDGSAEDVALPPQGDASAPDADAASSDASDADAADDAADARDDVVVDDGATE